MSNFKITNSNIIFTPITETIEKLSIKLLSNESFISIDNYFINFIEVITYIDTEFKINISNNTVFTTNVNNKNKETMKTLYLFNVNIPIKKYEILNISCNNNLQFILYFSNKENKNIDSNPIINILVSKNEQSDVFTYTNVVSVLDSIFD